MQNDRAAARQQFTYPCISMLPIYPTPTQRDALERLEAGARARGAIDVYYGVQERRVLVAITITPSRFAYFIVGARGNVAEYRPTASRRAPYVRPSRRHLPDWVDGRKKV